jgi:hypothetical protein
MGATGIENFINLDPLNKMALGWGSSYYYRDSGIYTLYSTGEAGERLILPRLDQRSSAEYFVVEFRAQPGEDLQAINFDAGIRHSGLAVWHVVEDSEINQTPPRDSGDIPDWEQKNLYRRAERLLRPEASLNRKSWIAGEVISAAPGVDPSRGRLEWTDGTPSGYEIGNIVITPSKSDTPGTASFYIGRPQEGYPLPPPAPMVLHECKRDEWVTGLTYFLDQNVHLTSDAQAGIDCFQFNGVQNVTLDCQNHHIMYGDGVQDIRTGNNGIRIDGTSQVNIRNCVIENFRQSSGILSYGSGGIIENNMLQNNDTGILLSSGNVQARNNTVRNNNDGMKLVHRNNASGNNVISMNHLCDNRDQDLSCENVVGVDGDHFDFQLDHNDADRQRNCPAAWQGTGYQSCAAPPPNQPPPAAGQVLLDSCKTSDWENGKTYLLSRDLEFSSEQQDASCISIAGRQDITLDCNGHRITDTDEMPNAFHYGIGVGNSQNITVRNCHVEHFNTGIICRGALLENNVIAHNNTGLAISASNAESILNNNMVCGNGVDLSCNSAVAEYYITSVSGSGNLASTTAGWCPGPWLNTIYSSCPAD